MIRNWFRTRRALAARNAELEGIVAKQIDELAGLRAELDEGSIRASQQIRDLNRGREISAEQIRRLTAERDELRQQNIRVRNALQVLRDDITREEQAALFGIHPNLPSATGPGMARVANQPKPWQEAGQ